MIYPAAARPEIVEALAELLLAAPEEDDQRDRHGVKSKEVEPLKRTVAS